MILPIPRDTEGHEPICTNPFQLMTSSTIRAGALNRARAGA
jgi:hypothetical protein